jgi:hypothetical protein
MTKEANPLRALRDGAQAAHDRIMWSANPTHMALALAVTHKDYADALTLILDDIVNGDGPMLDEWEVIDGSNEPQAQRG